MGRNKKKSKKSAHWEMQKRTASLTVDELIEVKMRTFYVISWMLRKNIYDKMFVFTNHSSRLLVVKKRWSNLKYLRNKNNIFLKIFGCTIVTTFITVWCTKMQETDMSFFRLLVQNTKILHCNIDVTKSDQGIFGQLSNTNYVKMRNNVENIRLFQHCKN